MDRHISEHDPHFGIFHELMPFKVREVLLVSSAYDAYIMEEDGSLPMRIINEYRGLNLSKPPRITRVSTVEQALGLLEKKVFDLVLTMPHLGVMDCHTFAERVKEIDPELPIVMLAHSVQDVAPAEGESFPCFIDNTYVWCCDSSLLLAIIKNVEDRKNADFDTRKAMVRIILYVEDSPVHRSQILPILYNEVVRQTQAVLDEGLNEQHRLLKMRARPKILTAATFEEAIETITRYSHNIFALLTDVRFFRGGVVTEDAGLRLIEHVRKDVSDLPVLVLSTDPANEKVAKATKAMFAIKDAKTISSSIHDFFLNNLGFGDFIFRMPDGSEVGRAANLFEFEQMLHTVPDACLLYHTKNNHFSNWVMARAEIALASRLSRHHFLGVAKPENLREDIIFKVHALRRVRQRGVISQFSPHTFDPEVTDFVSMGQGSLGGKARGIAFVRSRLHQAVIPGSPLADLMINVPQTCVITTQGFDDFIAHNRLHFDEGQSDEQIARRFEEGDLPPWLAEDLRAYLEKVTYPLSVRSSSMLEDSQSRPYAGLYSTFMLANGDPDFEVRFNQLVRAVKLVYSSTWFEGPRSFSRSIGQQNRESMAVIIQRLVGRKYGDYFYPPVSGVLQSYNFYPLAPTKPQDGIAYIALGFGKTVVEGERSLRFSPKHPENIPQLSTTEDMLKNTQRWFYSLDCSDPASFHMENSNLVRRDLDAAAEEYPVRLLSSTLFPEEQRVRDGDLPGPKILTFASLLKYHLFPLADVMNVLISLGREGMGSEVEIEFALDLDEDPKKSMLYFLQIRPTVTVTEREVRIREEERKKAVIYSPQSLGHGIFQSMRDIIYVKPDSFDTAKTTDIASEIGRLNRVVSSGTAKFLLIGIGRWGSADPWLGIPVKWSDISGAGAIIEIQGHGITAEPSQGTHFFHNITSLGIPYLMVREDRETRTAHPAVTAKEVDWQWIRGLTPVQETEHVCHVRLDRPFVLKVNGHTSEAVMFPES